MPKKQSIWVTEKYTAKNGKVYQRYVLDAQGNKIPRDSADAVVIAAQKAQNATTVAVQHHKRIMNKHLYNELLKTYQTNFRNLGSADIRDGKNTCRVIVVGTDGWLLLRVSYRGDSKRIFFNVETQEHIDFIPEKHKPEYGTKAIIWPNSPENSEKKGDDPV